jgi:hypothetical protein
VGDILSSLPMYMMIGIILVIGISQFNRMLGGILGVIFWIAVALIGTGAYEQGGGIGLPGFRFSRELFYGICAIFALFSGFTAYMAYVKKTRFVKPKSDDDT